MLIWIQFVAAVLAFQPDHALLRKVYEDHVSRCEHEFGSNDPRTAQAARDLGFFLKEGGDNKSAVPAFAKALRIDQSKYGADSPQALAGMIAVASVSPPVDAEALLRRALASRSMNSRLAVPALSTLGDLRLAAKDRAGAASFWGLALKHAEVVDGEESEAVEKILYSLAHVVEDKEAIVLLERALSIAGRIWGERHPETATCEVNLALALLKVGRNADAVQKAQEGLAGFEASLGPRHPRVAAAASALADALSAQGDSQGAEALDRRAREIRTLNALK